MIIRQTWKPELYINQSIRILIESLDYKKDMYFVSEQDSNRYLLSG